MPSPGVDAPCSLLVLGLLAGNCWPAPRVKQDGKQALRSPAQEQLLRAALSTAPPPLPSGQLLTILARTRASLMRSRRGV